jgi:hypothetical protein
MGLLREIQLEIEKRNLPRGACASGNGRTAARFIGQLESIASVD